MRFDIQHTIDIDAAPDRVWEHLADTSSYGEWNPFIRELTGEFAEGRELRARIAPPGGREMMFSPTVLAAKPGRELRWAGRLLVRGLFDGEHSFVIDPLPGGRTRLTQAERFTGLLVRMSRGSLGKTRDGFEQMNVALKHRAEAQI
ncbi:MAG: SRPBCC family protein [Solirubrobacteraceae bacterium]